MIAIAFLVCLLATVSSSAQTKSSNQEIKLVSAGSNTTSVKARLYLMTSSTGPMTSMEYAIYADTVYHYRIDFSKSRVTLSPWTGTIILVGLEECTDYVLCVIVKTEFGGKFQQCIRVSTETISPAKPQNVRYTLYTGWIKPTQHIQLYVTWNAPPLGSVGDIYVYSYIRDGKVVQMATRLLTTDRIEIDQGTMIAVMRCSNCGCSDVATVTPRNIVKSALTAPGSEGRSGTNGGLNAFVMVSCAVGGALLLGLVLVLIHLIKKRRQGRKKIGAGGATSTSYATFAEERNDDNHAILTETEA